ncbi:MAG TPA: hypothetical protein VJN18_19855 [Polyangiaceae bacterium]|nr:hypothetical protein [Polyangiaceae bacterium]
MIAKFVGPTPTAEFPKFLVALSARMPAACATLIFDLTELDGYNPETKEPMKAWLLEHKLAIREIVVVVPKSRLMVRTVTAAIGLAVGVKITVREEVSEAEQQPEACVSSSRC